MFCSQCGNNASGSYCAKCGAATGSSTTEAQKSSSGAPKKNRSLLIASSLALVGITVFAAILTFNMTNNSVPKVSLDGLSGTEILNTLISDGFCPEDAAGQYEGNQQMCMADEDHAIAIFAGLDEAGIAEIKNDSLNYLYGKDWIMLYQDQAIADLAENYDSTLFLKR